MPNSITASALKNHLYDFTIIDVRKEPAYLKNSQIILTATWRKPFNAENWFNEFSGRKVVVYCVHGHEVSQGVCGFLLDQGIDACYLEGGLEGWCEQHYPVEGGEVQQ